MSIVSLHQVSLKVANHCILQDVDWQIHARERIALVGRNGAGKSTLLRLLLGELNPDSGKIQRLNNLRTGGLTQAVPAGLNESVYYFLVKGLGETGEILAQFHQLHQEGKLRELSHYQQQIDALHAWDLLPKVEQMATRLGLDVNARMNDLSGGMIRRVLLAAALITEPDLLLLDEPTNHLDINSIEWLEAYLKTYRGTVVLVTHDRVFLDQVASKIVEIDRARLLPFSSGYEKYLETREAIRIAEEKHNALFDKKLAQEEAWIRTGIKARRTRNEGRVRALKTLREAWKKRREEQGKITKAQVGGDRSGEIVIEAKNLEFHYPQIPIIKPLSLLLMRGDKLGIIGPNGCGKTTLVRLLLGDLKPEKGDLRHGTGLQVAYFDQLRAQLDENATVMENVAEGSDYVTVNGKQKHVASYLKEFLFDPERFNQRVSTLSGGERNRLLLAKLLAKPVNLLVLDEPTNDLDIETLELLESLLLEYTGTLLLISHDRAFINQVVTSILVYEDEGRFKEYVGGFDDYQRFKKQQKEQADIGQNKEKLLQNSTQVQKKSDKLSFNEQRELKQLPAKIESLESELSKLQSAMNSPQYYQKAADSLAADKTNIERLEAELEQAYSRWEILEQKG